MAASTRARLGTQGTPPDGIQGSWCSAGEEVEDGAGQKTLSSDLDLFSCECPCGKMGNWTLAAGLARLTVSVPSRNQ